MSAEEDLAFICRAMGLFSEVIDDHESLFWRVRNDVMPLKLFVKCSDIFDWATADLEPLTPDNITVLEQAIEDCKAISHRAAFLCASTLFCARIRGRRPQYAAYGDIPEVWDLYDACGPTRKPGFGNPHQHPRITP